MDLDQLDVLQEKINHAIKIIEQLKSENQRLVQENEELRSNSNSKELLVQQLREENNNLKQTQNNVSSEKEEKIRSKVEEMLAKLDELQYNL